MGLFSWWKVRSSFLGEHECVRVRLAFWRARPFRMMSEGLRCSALRSDAVRFARNGGITSEGLRCLALRNDTLCFARDGAESLARCPRFSGATVSLTHPPPSLPYKVDTSRPSFRTNWTRLVPFPRQRCGRRALSVCLSLSFPFFLSLSLSLFLSLSLYLSLLLFLSPFLFPFRSLGSHG